MNEMTETVGLRSFLLATLKLIADGEKESCRYIEDNISQGIASILTEKYSRTYERCGFNSDSIDNINQYYMNWNGVANGREELYVCDESDGLQLLVALALNDIY